MGLMARSELQLKIELEHPDEQVSRFRKAGPGLSRS